MRMLPIKFRQIYSDDEHGSDQEPYYRGFKPIDTPYYYISKRAVELTPFSSHAVPGGIEVKILEFIGFKQPLHLNHVRYWHELATFYISHKATEWFSPTPEQCTIMQLLATNDIRGRYAEEAIHSLYYSLLLTNPKCEEFIKYLPDVHAWYMAQQTKIR